MNHQHPKTRNIIIGVLILFSVVATAIVFIPETTGNYTYDIYKFSSYDELQSYLDRTQSNTYPYGYAMEDTVSGMQRDGAFAEKAGTNEAGSDSVSYSETNVQVAGVDEPDIVKSDGTYLYNIADSSIHIVKAYPPSEASHLSTINFDEHISPIGLFINEDTLIVFGNSYLSFYEENDETYDYDLYYYPGTPGASILIYDISDRSNPTIQDELLIEGSYFDARMIEDMIYVVIVEYTYQLYDYSNGNETFRIPEIHINNESFEIPIDSISYVDIPDTMESMTHVIAFDINDKEFVQQSFLLGASQTMYVSSQAIYLVSAHYDYTPGIFGMRITQDEITTIIHKIAIKDGTVEYTAQAEVPGTLLNQFSMDEHNGYFRIATTIGSFWSEEDQSSNNIYILDGDLSQIAAIEDIAPGEQIYAARFLGDMAYLVTFKKIDPFFTIDLSDPYNPEILGKLKIPGYSDYLHPYDEFNIIGIGKDTVEASEDEMEWRELDFSWYQGVKLAIFNVSDVSNPQEMAKEVIGDRGTSSQALYDHKAFLFDREKELLVIPIDLYEIDEEIKEQQGNYTGSKYGEFTFQGVYVFRVTLEDGFELQGRISHLSEQDMMKSGFYPDYQSTIVRSLYIEDTLYTISQSKIGMHSLYDLEEIALISLE